MRLTAASAPPDHQGLPGSRAQWSTARTATAAAMKLTQP